MAERMHHRGTREWDVLKKREKNQTQKTRKEEEARAAVAAGIGGAIGTGLSIPAGPQPEGPPAREQSLV